MPRSRPKSLKERIKSLREKCQAMSMSSYDELLKQVESLKMENTHLRRELQDNSSHLTKLENEASSMKDVLSHLHTSMSDDLDTNLQLERAYQGTTDAEANTTTTTTTTATTTTNDTLDQNSNSSNDESTTEQNWLTSHHNVPHLDTSSLGTQLGAGEVGGGERGGSQKSQSNSPTESPSKRRSNEREREMYSIIQELDQERTSLLHEIDAEDKHRKWYYEQLESLTHKIENLPLTEQYNLQTDMARRQLEYEAQRLRELMKENLGSAEQIAQRHEARLKRIRHIEQEMLLMQQRHHEQLEQEKRDSGTCDHLESERDGVIVVDAATNTLVSGDCESESLSADQEGQQLNNQNFSALYHGAWPIGQDGQGMGEGSLTALGQQDTASVMSFHSSHASSTGSRRVSNQQLGTKVEMVYSLLSMLGTHDKDDMSRTLLAMSSSQDSCIAMRQSGCLPLLIQLLHGSDKESGLLGNTRGGKAARARAAAALHNIVHSHPDDKRGRREARVLRLLEQIRAHCDQLRDSDDDEDGRKSQGSHAADIDHHPGPAIAALMKLSFDEEHRHAICTLGGLQAIAELLQVDHDVNGNTAEQYNITMRRYACMALTNLTFGDGTNKALLCSMKACMYALVAQLHSSNEDLRQVAASVLRNLSWRADLASKKTLREVGAVVALMQAAMEVKKESTLKSILSALWNLSAHCSENKADICAVEGSLAFLVSTLTYKSPSKTLAIIENGGGILRNISSHIAVREDYRQILRQHGCLQILLKHLRSPSLTIVSNACGTLWNLSARCQEDQQSLWDMNAVSMLRNLVHSKHKMISMGSAAALKNLLAAKPAMVNLESDRFSKSNMPTLHVRKQRALEAEIDQSLAETCDNVESPQGSPTEVRKHDSHEPQRFLFGDNCGIYPVGDIEHRRSMMRTHFGRNLSADASALIDSRLRSPSRPVSRSASQDSVGSVGSVHSDISHDRSRVQNVLAKSSKLLQERQNVNLDRRRDLSLQRYNSSADSQKSSDSGRSGPGSASRIVQVMQEVALHAGLETGSYETNSADNTPPSVRRGQGNQAGARRIPGMFSRVQASLFRGEESAEGSAFTPPQHNQEGLNNHQTDNRNLPFTRRMETIHINDTESQEDQPINYSLKYSEPTPRNNQASQGQGPGFVKPIPKVGNFVAGLIYGPQQKVPNVSSANVTSYDDKPTNVGDEMEMTEYSGYAETDLDNMDQPTNYSIRFAEHTDECHFGDQPINYSTRFQEPESNCADCKLEEARRTNEIIEDQEVGINEDTVRTFYTEGTPLNYLSTATSMNDLSKAAAKEDKSAAGSNAGVQGAKYHECDHHSSSMSGSMSTGRHSGSTIVPVKTVDAANIQNNNVPATKSPPSDPAATMCYNDSSGVDSPSEKPIMYCEEGTPTCFSRVSSLSSLHSGDAQDHPNNNVRHHETAGLQSIDENDQLDITHSADVTLRPAEPRDESYHSANTTLGSQGGESTTSSHPKSVTFDENNQVQETPLMFSRCSSLGSLSSFDAHSVHSSVVSEYSRRASEVVSPSDLPDSPSDTMPPSPHHRKSPIKFDLNESEATEYTEANITQIENPAAKKSAVAHSAHHTPKNQRSAPIGVSQTPPEAPPKPEVFMDSTQTYATESSPAGFSCATSLSALTIDDEPEIKKEPGLRRVPVGQEDDTPSLSQLQPQRLEESQSDCAVNFLDEDSSGSEGDEYILAECINLAMPNNSKKKMKRSTSDGFLKKKAGIPKINNLAQTPPKSRLPSKIQNAFSGRPQITSTPRMNASYHGSIPHQDDIFSSGIDSPKNFATEGTPLNFSQSNSLSDISESNIDATPERTVRPAGHKTPKSTERPTSAADDKSDISSVSEDCEDLLSEAIEAAMPKTTNKSKKKLMLMDRKAEGAENKDRGRFQSPNFHPKKNVEYQPGHARSQVTHPGCQSTMSGDTVQVYAMEGTPVNFSTATSLSDLTIDSVDGLQDKTKQAQDSAPIHMGDDSVFHHAGHVDSPRLYGMEGTPVSFSRNDSLSSLSCDEDADLEGAKKQLRMQGEGNGSPSPNGLAPPGLSPNARSRPLSARKPGSGLSSPGLPKSKAFSRVQRSLQYGKPSGTSPTSSAPESPSKAGEDQTQSYAVEGTPMCFSRNSSLSSLNSDEHEALANKSGDSGSDPAEAVVPIKDQNESFQVEDTPACFSHNSSLSALSVESLSFEPTPSETALLEECINAALPKSKPGKGKGGKGSRLPRTSPTGGASAEQSARKKSPKSESPCFDDATTSETGSKNELGPQSRSDLANTTESQIVKSHDSNKSPSESRVGWRRSPTQDNDSLPKQQKDVHNQEKVLGASGGRDDDSITDGEDQSQENLMVNSSGEPFDNKQEEEIEIEANKLALLSLETGETAGDTEDEDEMEKSDTSKQEECIVAKEELEATKEEYDSSFDLGCTPLQEPMVSSFGDITNEQFPDMGASLVSNITTPDEEQKNLLLEAGCSADTTLRQADEVNNSENYFDDSFDSASQDGQVYDDEDDDKGFYMSEEEERALEENANIILTEISFSKDLSYSTCDDDLFIENETLSLVSNDYASDTASEASLCLSSSSKTLSEQASEASTMSRPSSARSTKMPIKIAGPRIVKPGERPTAGPQQSEAPKGIRGRRKPLYSKPSTSQVKPQNTAENVKSIRGGGVPQRNVLTPGKVNRPISKAIPKQATPGQPAKRTPAKVVPPRTSSIGSTPKSGSSASTSKSNSPNSVKGSSPQQSNQASPRTPKTSKLVTPQKIGIPGKKPNSSIPRGNGGKQLPNTTNTTSTTKEVERPKPPIKQGTFTKDSPTQNAPEISPTYSPDVDMNANKANISSHTAIIDDSLDITTQQPTLGGKKDSTPSLGMRRNIATSNLQGRGSTSNLPKAGNRTNLTKTASGSSLAKTSSGSSLNKTQSGSSLHKTTSGPSLAKTPSNGSIPKTGSTGSLKSAGKGGSMKKSDSQVSLKRVTANGRPVTPTRKNSSGSMTGAMTASPSPGSKKLIAAKKPAVSKIASLWRKEEKEDDVVPDTKKTELKAKTGISKTPVKTGVNKILSGSPNSTSSSDITPPRSLPGRKMHTKVNNVKVETMEHTESPDSEGQTTREGITRSSTYDKLPPEGPDTSAEEGEFSFSVQSSQPKNLWRRTYTISTEDNAMSSSDREDDSSGSTLSLPINCGDQPKKSSLWKRHTLAAEPPLTREGTVIQSKTGEKVKKSLWRRNKDAAKLEPKHSNIPGPMKKSPDGQWCEVQWGGVWVKQGDDVEEPGTSSPAHGSKPNSPAKRTFAGLLGGKKTQANGVAGKGSPQKTSQNDVKGEVLPSTSDDTQKGLGLPATSPTKYSSGSDIRINSPNAAIVPPFNYTPSTPSSNGQKSVVQNGTVNPKPLSEVAIKNNINTSGSSPNSPNSSPSKATTKTEMLIARRRQYMNSLKQEESSEGDDPKKGGSCLVTTV